MASIKYISILILFLIVSLLSIGYTATAYAPVKQNVLHQEIASLGVEPEAFIRSYNQHIKDDYIPNQKEKKESSNLLIPPRPMEPSFVNGIGTVKIDYGNRGMLELAVRESDGSLIEVKFSGSNEVASCIPVGTLTGLATEVSKDGIDRFLNALQVTEGSKLPPGFHSEAERDGNIYLLRATKEGWSFIVRPTQAEYPVLDDKPSLPSKRVEDAQGKSKKASRDKEEDSVVKQVSNPEDLLVLVNKTWYLPEGYVPPDLMIPKVRFGFSGNSPKKQMRKEAADALKDLFQAAEKNGFVLYAQSGYRPYERQQTLFASNTRRFQSEAKANSVSARPGHSEHQTGLAMDITSSSVNMKLLTSFGDTPEGRWVAAHAHEFGFIIRYPKGKEAITGYQYEPWHLRYVGKSVATEIFERKLTLEEYLERPKKIPPYN